MLRSIRELVQRPIDERDRNRLAGICISALIFVAVVLRVLSEPDGTPGHTAAIKPAATLAPAATSAPLAEMAPASRSDSEEGAAETEDGGDGVASRGEISRARSAGRSFLSVYLPYVQGVRSAREIPAATQALRDDLAANPPRVPPGSPRRRARVSMLEVQSAASDRMVMLALIAEGEHYTVRLELGRYATEWLVTKVGP